MNQYKIDVLMLCRGASYQGLGGPVWSIRALLKQQDRQSLFGYLLRAVLCDGVYKSYSELADLKMNNSSKRPISPSLLYVWQAATSVPRLLRNLNRGSRDCKGEVILHCHDFISTYLCRLRFGHRYPLLLTIHAKGGGVREILTDYPVLRNTPIAGLARHIETSAVRWANVVAFPSSGARDLFSYEHPKLLGSKDVRIVHAGIDVDELCDVLEEKSIRQKYNVPEGDSFLFCIAAMVHDKGLDTLIESIGLLPHEILAHLTCLIVAREGPLKPQLESLIGKYELQDKVRILGFLPRSDMIQLLKQATLFVLPSRVAIFDVVLLEAAVLGTPVITSVVGGNLEMFNSESAFWVKPNDPTSLAQELILVLTNDLLRKHVSKIARTQVIEKFSLSSMAKSYEDIYTDMIKNA